MIDEFLNRRDGESIAQYKLRLLLGKEDNITDASWRDIAELPEFSCGEDYVRRVAKGCVLSREVYESSSPDKTIGLYDSVMERMRAHDERVELNKALRSTARLERRMDIMEGVIAEAGKHQYPMMDMDDGAVSSDCDNEMVVVLSDLHIGASFDNQFGTYNIETAEKRLMAYERAVLNARNAHKTNTAHVVLLGDMISGSIHKTIALTNEEDVITQTMKASEMIARFVYRLSLSFETVYVRSVTGNHSRIDLKDDALKVERLDRIIPWYIKTSLSHLMNVRVVDEADATFDEMRIYGKSYYLVHGDFDAFDVSSPLKLAAMTGKMPYAVLYAHKHHPAFTESSGIKMIQSGSLCGSGDDYTVQKRLCGGPNQTILICDTTGIKCWYFVDLGERNA